MSAIIRDNLKVNIFETLLDDINGNSANKYYIGIGKTDIYNDSDNIIDVNNFLYDERLARGNLESIKKVTSSSLVAVRNNWSKGRIYNSWNDKKVNNPFYVLTDENEVYVCVQQGKDNTGEVNPSTVQPSAGSNKRNIFKTYPDNYAWKYLFAIQAAKIDNFLTAGFFPIEKAEDSNSNGDQFVIQEDARLNKAGQIIGIEILDSGEIGDYEPLSPPIITIEGNGNASDILASVTISDEGRIIKAEIDIDSNLGLLGGNNFDYASIKLTGDGSGSLRPIIGPKEGLGANPLNDLKSSSIMLNIKPQGLEDGQFNITNDFRQISLFKNLKNNNDDTIFNSRVLKVNRSLSLSDNSVPFVINEEIEGQTSGITAYIDEIDSNGNIRFHQNERTINGNFEDGESLEGNEGGRGTIDSGNITSSIDIYSGDLLYTENRAPISRGADQTEDIKIILTV